jgi:hypothetical protein
MADDIRPVPIDTPFIEAVAPPRIERGRNAQDEFGVLASARESWDAAPLGGVEEWLLVQRVRVAVAWKIVVWIFAVDKFVSQIKRNQMADIKTSLTGLVTGLAGILSHFGIIIPESWQLPIVLIGGAIMGILAKDAKGTSLPRN